jgi:hypothetical protein
MTLEAGFAIRDACLLSEIKRTDIAFTAHLSTSTADKARLMKGLTLKRERFYLVHRFGADRAFVTASANMSHRWVN